MVVPLIPLTAQVPSHDPIVQSSETHSTATDSTSGIRSYALPELVISSVRIPSTARRSPAPVTLISRIDIERSGAASLGDVLMTGPGLFIKDYGASSGIKTLSQRGMGSEHTLVLFNGLPINSLQNGSIDFGALPADEIDRVEVIRGGQSASFGANAVAGVVNVVTRSSGKDQARVRIGAGSFGERTGYADFGTAGDDVRWRVGGGIQHIDGDYPFTFSNGPASYHLTRTNAGYDAWHGSADLGVQLIPSIHARITGLYLASERGVAGVVVGPYSRSQATQEDQQGIVQAEITQTLSPLVWWETKAQAQYAYQRYADPDVVVGGVPLNTSFRNSEERAELQLHADIEGVGKVTAGGDAVTASGHGSAVAGEPVRKQFGVFVLGQHQFRLLPDSMVVLSIHPALRYDNIRDVSSVVSPQLGLQLLLFPQERSGEAEHLLRIHGTVGKNFRTPTFNELFYAGGGGMGNPNLRPERSTTADLGAGIILDGGGTHTCDLTLFDVEMHDRIIWTTTGSSNTTPKNLRNVISRGIEATYEWHWLPAGIDLSLSYVRSQTEKKSPDYPGDPNIHTIVPYAPQEILTWNIGWGGTVDNSLVKSWGVSANGSHVGFRYTTEDNAEFVPAYTITNVSIVGEFILWRSAATVRCDVRNIFNAEFEVMRGYPMPQRSYRVSLSISF
jgi:vitamin B12 transporter